MVNIYILDYIIMAILIVASAILALEAKEIIQAIFFFDIFIIGIGGMFLLFNAGFVAMFQLAVYAGAVAVIVLFAVMLTRRMKTGDEVISKTTIRARIASIFLVLVIAAIMIVLVLQYTWPTTPDYPVSSGGALFEYIVQNFEAAFLGIGLLLATALVGGVALLRGRQKTQEVAN